MARLSISVSSVSGILNHTLVILAWRSLPKRVDDKEKRSNQRSNFFSGPSEKLNVN